MPILYSPISLDTPVIDAERLWALFRKHARLHYTGLWDYYTIRQKPVSHDDPDAYTKAWRARYHDDGIRAEWEPEFAAAFPEATRFLEALPFRDVAHVNLLRQLKDVPPHIDYDKGEPTFTQSLCYKWLVVPGVGDSFYIEKTGGERIFINPPPGHGCFVIAETAVRHGAIHRGDKLIMSIFGLLDENRHTELISQSVRDWAGEAVQS